MYLYDISSERLTRSTPIQRTSNRVGQLNQWLESTHNLYLNDLLKLVDQCIDRCTTSEWKRMEKDGKGWKRMEKVQVWPPKIWSFENTMALTDSHHFSEQSRSPQSSRLTICHPLGVMTVTVTFSPLFCTVLWSSHWGDQHAQHWLLLRILSFKHPFWEWSNFDLSHVERVVHICSWKKLGRNFTALLVLFISSSHLKFAILTELTDGQHITHRPFILQPWICSTRPTKAIGDPNSSDIYKPP
jgi:hypothetical protein